MAKQPIYEHYHEDSGSFKTLSSRLRKVSSDKTINKGNYVSFYNDVCDMISGDKNEAQGVKDVSYDKETKNLIIKTKDGKTDVVNVEDNYLDSAEYNADEKNIELTLNNGNKLEVNVETLENKFYNKEETYNKEEITEEITKVVDEKIVERINPLWGEF